jgi:hypothetical protein
MELKRNSRLPIKGMILVELPFTSQGHWIRRRKGAKKGRYTGTTQGRRLHE